MPAAKQPNAPPLGVARFNEPEILTQVVFEVKLIAPAQLSFAGAACVTQILNVLDAIIVLGSV